MSHRCVDLNNYTYHRLHYLPSCCRFIVWCLQEEEILTAGLTISELTNNHQSSLSRQAVPRSLAIIMSSSEYSVTPGKTQAPLAKQGGKLLDLAFAMDTTGSMGSYINAARDNVRKVTEEIVAKETCDVRLALVNYRDHPPQDTSYVTEVHDFTPAVAEMKRWLENTSANGGGDAPEAVADALHQVVKLSWRPEATKICVLISDAPPHGLQQSGDTFPNGCPDGLDPMMTARHMAEKAITLYVAGCEPSITPYKDFFAALAYVTGGQYVPLQAASSLTSVIVGSSQEEISLEKLMDQVKQMFLAEVSQKGEANVDLSALSARIRDQLNIHGESSIHLKVNKKHLESLSAHGTSLAACTCMEDVRKKWKPESAAPGITAPVCAAAAVTASAEAEASLSEEAFVYETEEGEVTLEQAQRMLQKTCMRSEYFKPE